VQVKIRQQQMLQLAGPARAHPSRLMKIMRAVSWWSRFRRRRDCGRWPQPNPGGPGGRVSNPSQEYCHEVGNPDSDRSAVRHGNHDVHRQSL